MWIWEWERLKMRKEFPYHLPPSPGSIAKPPGLLIFLLVNFTSPCFGCKMGRWWWARSPVGTTFCRFFGGRSETPLDSGALGGIGGTHLVEIYFDVVFLQGRHTNRKINSSFKTRHWLYYDSYNHPCIDDTECHAECVNICVLLTAGT